ncbi:MAG TPA: ABC transporter permease [Polyangiaceae bacterium]|nr:ABC transporter permease [Polyangiaceae bacterium]
MNAIWIALKDLKLLARDRVALFWVLGFPLLFAGLFGEVIASASAPADRKSQLVVVDEQRSAASAQLVTALKAQTALEVSHADLATARAHVRRGDRLAFLRLPDEGGKPQLGVDWTRASEADALSRSVAAAVAPAAVAPSRDGMFDVERVGASAGNLRVLAFPAALLWCLMACAATFAVSLAAERSAGTELRLRAAPVSRATLLGGKALACLLACLAGTGLLVFLGWVALDIGPQSLWGLALALPSACVAFVGLVFLFGSVGGSEQAVAGAGWASLIVLAMLGGAMVPLSALPQWLVPASHLSPVKWGIVAFEGVYFRGFAISDLLLPCGVLVGMGAVAGLVGLSLMTRRHARA